MANGKRLPVGKQELFTIHLRCLLSISVIRIIFTVIAGSFAELSFEIALKMRFAGRADLPPDFLDAQMSGFEKLPRFLQSPVVDVFHRACSKLFFEQTLKMGNGQVNRCRQFRNGKRFREVLIGFGDDFFYSIIHLFGGRGEQKK